MKIVGIIPARMESSRFPGKSMAEILGMPMIGHMFHRCKMSDILDEVYVATCNKEIFDYIGSLGGKPIMTANTHERATDRTGEAFEKIMDAEGKDFDGVLMIQGDEPSINPALLDDMISFHINQKLPYVTNLVSKIQSHDEFNNPNVVKVVKNRKDRILYFSRSPIPSNTKFSGELPMWKQLGLILFTKDALKTYALLKPTDLEIIESVDMNRILENDLIITAYPTSEISQSVDVQKDISIVEKLLELDDLVDHYLD